MERDAKGHFEPLIRASAKELADLIREYCRSQRHLWRQIPYLALLAETDRQSKFRRSYYVAYEMGYLNLLERHPSVHVDLESGELIGRSGDIIFSLDDDAVLDLFGNLTNLDAQSIIDRLRGISAEHSEADRDRQQKWRKEMAEKYGIQEMYVRRSTEQVPAPFSPPRREPLIVNVPTTLQLVHEEVQRLEEESQKKKGKKK